MIDCRSPAPLLGLIAALGGATQSLAAQRSADTLRLDKAGIEAGTTLQTSLPAGSYASRVIRVALLYDGSDRRDVAGQPPWSYAVSYSLTEGTAPAVTGTRTLSRTATEDVYEAVTLYQLATPGAATTVTLTPQGQPAVTGTPPTVFTLFLIIESDAILSFDPAAPASRPVLSLTGAVASWPAVPGAVEYDLEWVFIDHYRGTVPNPFAVKVATRVTLSDTSYSLPEDYPAGALHVRVRAVGRHIGAGQADAPARRPGPWSTVQSQAVAGASRLEPDKNWLHQITFAEEGKRTRSIAYYDGLLRERQRIGVSEADSVALVGETKYDHEGRPVMSILPAPRAGTALNYAANFNQDAGGSSLDPEDYARGQGQGAPLSLLSGAGRYYSSNNTITGPHSDYIPHAAGYVYTLTEHTRDNTGRVRRSAGVGDSLRLGGGHDSQFLYGNASATELRRMFASQVGAASHYRRNVARDPNGQGSVTYVDHKDRTIATALVGVAPDALVPLPSNVTATATYSLNDNNEVDRTLGESRSINRIANMEPGTPYDFTYDFTGVSYGVDIGAGQPYCATCSYELSIWIASPQGDSVPLSDLATGTTDSSITRTFQNPAPPATCQADQSTPYTPSSVQFQATFSELGEYVVTKVLRLTAGSVDLMLADMQGQPGYAQFGVYLQAELAQVDSTQCAESCEAHCQAATTDPALLAECVAGCEALVSGSLREMEEAQCRSYEEAMLADVSPGGWLYENPTWLNAAAAGETFGGQPYPGSPDALEQIWQPDWAGQLIDSHLEWCHLDACSILIPSDTFSAAMALVGTYQDALAGGWLNPLAMAVTARGPPTSTSQWDPFFFGGPGSHHRAAVSDTLRRFVVAQDGTVLQTIWEFVADPQSVYGPGTSQTSVPLDEQWQLFRAWYLGLKQRVQIHYMEVHEQCDYLDDPNAHFPKPPAFTTVDELLAARDEALAEYCSGDGGLCDARALVWREELEASCPTMTDATADQVEQLLAQYCGEVCGLDNPLGLLTDEALAQGHPILTQVAALISPCDLAAITDEDPFEYGESCRQDCESTLVLHECADQLLDLLDRRHPSPAGSDVRITVPDLLGNARACFAPGSRPSGDLVVVDSLRGLRWPWRARGDCALAFYDSTGRYVPPSLIQEFLRSAYAATYPVTITQPRPEHFTHVVVTTRLTVGARLRLYVFSNCGFPTTDVEWECAIAEAAGDCVAEAFDLLNLHLRQALAAPPVDVRDESECFDALSAERAVAAFVTPQRPTLLQCAASPCLVSLFTAKGTRIDLGQVLTFGDPVPADVYPGSFQRDPIYGVPFAGFAVEVLVRLPNGDSTRVKAFVFSNCPFDRQAACERVPADVDWPTAEPVPADSVCWNQLIEEAESYADEAFNAALGELEITTRTVHANRCFDVPFHEDFRYTFTAREYHYTLFYYDQADNLVQTVPPAGVDAPWASGPDPDHLLRSRYRYNSLNQVLSDSTPDGGQALFWYNSAAQLRFTQNADQAVSGDYSFTKYDAQNRVIETGVVAGMTLAQLTSEIDTAAFPSAQAFTLTDLTRTAYDTAAPAVCAGFTDQRNLRGRVSALWVEPQPGSVTAATCYGYDPHGNVAALLQVIDGLGAKRIDYEYDLVSGKVNAIHYQRGQADQMLHRYEYDADNRLVAVYTSTDDVIWTRDARYEYYKHGPIARLELSEPVVQGVDYVYTIQGWLKGINANTLAPFRDPGRDGDTTLAANPRRYVPVDAFAFSLGYHAGDYTAAGAAATAFEAQTLGSGLASQRLFNGNITHSVAANRALMAGGGSPLGTAYRHDQLNRLDSARAFFNANVTTNTWGPAAGATDEYLSTVAYDANGNVVGLTRNTRERPGVDPPSSMSMDILGYTYPVSGGRPASNKLQHVDDGVPAARHTGDIDDQATGNYAYTGRGELKRDQAESITSIAWNSYGMVASIDRSLNPDLELRYDASQRRVIKIIKPDGAPQSAWQYLYYARDVQGNTVATYRRREVVAGGGGTVTEITLQDVTLDGLGRVGLLQRELVLTPAVATAGAATRVAGRRRYELTDNLRSVRLLVSDRRGGLDVDGDGQAEFYEPVQLASFDYYPFGYPVPGRFDYNVAHRYGFNGAERDDEVAGVGRIYDFGARMYSASVGRFLSTDPLSPDYPQYSPYLFAGNKPIWAVDMHGLQECVDATCSPSTASDVPAESGPPTIAGERERRQNIMQNVPGRFDISDNPEARSYAYPWYAIPEAQQVTQHEAFYEEAANRYAIDPDLLKAIAWMESTHGWYDELVPGDPKSIRPMNVYARIWGDLGLTRESIKDPRVNIEAGAFIVASIQSRIENQSVEKIATLYNRLRETQVSEYGATVATYYRDKPWMPRPPLPQAAPTIHPSKVGPILLRQP